MIEFVSISVYKRPALWQIDGAVLLGVPMTALLLLLSQAFAAPSVDARATHDALLQLWKDLRAESETRMVCFTPLVRALQENWGLFTPEEQAAFTAHLAPFATDLTDGLAPAGDAPPPPASGEPCFIYDDNPYETLDDPKGRFQVQWEPDAIDEETAQDLLDALTYSYETEIDELGWREPDGMSRYPMMIYVYEDNRTAAAYTTVGRCSGVGYMPYIVIASGSFYGGSWYEDMVAHEFVHASQYAYTDDAGSYNYNVDLWWWEATATWAQEYVYPDNNWWSQYISGYTDATYLAMQVSNQSDNTKFWHMYGMAIWAFYLDQHWGGHDMVQDTWEYAAEHWNTAQNVDDWTEGVGVDFDEAYQDFIVTNVVMDYDPSRYFGNVKVSATVSELPDSGESSSTKAPQGYGQNYLKIKSDAAEAGTDAVVHVDGENDNTWLALLVTVDGNDIEDVQTFDLDDTNQGDLDIRFDGDKEFWIVLSPMDNKSSGRSYTWSVTVDESAVVTDGEDDTADEVPDLPEGQDGDDAFNPEKADEGTGCGCATGTSGSSVGLALGLAALMLRRRR